MSGQPEKVNGARMSRRDAEESRIVGLALLRLRNRAGMTLRQVAAATGSTVHALAGYERGDSLPREETRQRIVVAVGATMADLYRAQQGAPGNGPKPEDGTLPPDVRLPQPPSAHKAAVRLAQECGKAVAHCCLVFLELQAGGWSDLEPNGARQQEGGRL